MARTMARKAIPTAPKAETKAIPTAPKAETEAVTRAAMAMIPRLIPILTRIRT